MIHVLDLSATNSRFSITYSLSLALSQELLGTMNINQQTVLTLAGLAGNVRWVPKGAACEDLKFVPFPLFVLSDVKSYFTRKVHPQ